MTERRGLLSALRRSALSCTFAVLAGEALSGAQFRAAAVAAIGVVAVIVDGVAVGYE